MMKTIHEMLRNTVMMMIVCLPALVSAEQMYAVNYQNHYRGVQSPMYNGPRATTVPTGGFRSTSAYSVQLNQENLHPLLNADGTVNEEAYGVGSQDAPKVRRLGGQSGTPGQDGIQQPIGDALIPLTLLAGAYLIIRAARRKARSMMNERCK